MTRLALLADIHGNLPALQAVLRDLAQFQIHQVVVAGDSVNWGPFSREVLELISARQWAVVRGNNEYYALDYVTPRMPAGWADFTMPPWLRQQLGDAWLRLIACQPDTLPLRFIDAQPLRVFHGIPDNPWVAIFPDSPASEIETWLRDIPESTIVCAHSHIPMERHVSRWQIFNPGSVGVPVDGDRRASYMILQGDHQGWQLVEHRRVAYDYDSLFAEFERRDFVKDCGITAALVIEEFRSARLQLHPYLNWKKAHHLDQPDDMDLLQAFLSLEDTREYQPPAYRDLSAELYRD